MTFGIVENLPKDIWIMRSSRRKKTKWFGLFAHKNFWQTIFKESRLNLIYFLILKNLGLILTDSTWTVGHFIFSEGSHCSVIRNQLCQLSPCWMFYRQPSVEAVAVAMMFQCEVFRVMWLPRGLMTRSTLSCHTPAWPDSTLRSTFNCGLMKFWFSRARVTVTIRHHHSELLF